MRFTVRALFVLTTLVALCTWIAVTLPDLAFHLAALASLWLLWFVIAVLAWQVSFLFIYLKQKIKATSRRSEPRRGP